MNKINSYRLVWNFLLGNLYAKKIYIEVVTYERLTLNNPVEFFIEKIISGNIAEMNKELIEAVRLRNEKKIRVGLNLVLWMSSSHLGREDWLSFRTLLKKY
jgi:hypothetical protein